MFSGKFRPWGDTSWVLSKIDHKLWNFIGCLSTEERCTEAVRILKSAGVINSNIFFEVLDPVTTVKHTQKIERNKKTLEAIDSEIGNNIHQLDLLVEDITLFNKISEIVNQSIPNIILDISTFPKRFFFPFVKTILQHSQVENLLITYTNATKYPESDLSEDPEPWYPLPLFRQTSFPEDQYDLAIVGTGFMPFSLPKLLKDKHSKVSLRLIFPFPPGPPNYHRSWEFVRKIEKYYTFKEGDEIIRINSLDVCEAFDHICSASNYGEAKVLFAPYGPKPISLAMCIFASLTGSPVYYTQPKLYNPDYSTGIKDCISYCIKLDNKLLYSTTDC